MDIPSCKHCSLIATGEWKIGSSYVAFDSVKGMPDTNDRLDKSNVVKAVRKNGRFTGSQESLRNYCAIEYLNWHTHQGYFESTSTHDLHEKSPPHKSILARMLCDYYTSARAAMKRLIPCHPAAA